LYDLAVSRRDECEIVIPAVTGSNEPELFEYIVSYLKSDQLMDLEDHGFSQLLSIHDEITELRIKDRHSPVLDFASGDHEGSGGPTVTEQADQTVVGKHGVGPFRPYSQAQTGHS
ncbi:hypothetical protein KUCAC02_004071, partial [Chaenocephalus aceratus]